MISFDGRQAFRPQVRAIHKMYKFCCDPAVVASFRVLDAKTELRLESKSLKSKRVWKIQTMLTVRTVIRKSKIFNVNSLGEANLLFK